MTVKFGKDCLCGNGEECKGMNAAFALLGDHRTGYVQLPPFHENPETQALAEINQLRQCYLRHLRPTDDASDLPQNIALHHFHPTVLERFSKGRGKRRSAIVVPKTITEEEMMHLRMKLKNADKVLDEMGNPTGEYFFAPNYKIKRSKVDLKRIIKAQRILNDATSSSLKKNIPSGERTKEAPDENNEEKESVTRNAAADDCNDAKMMISPVTPVKEQAYMKSPPNRETREAEYSQLKAWEEERRHDHRFLLEKLSCKWRSAITVLEEGVEEVARAERLVRGAALANQAYADAMEATFNDVFLDDDCNVVTDAWRQNQLMAKRSQLESSVDISPIDKRGNALLEADGGSRRSLLSPLLASQSKSRDKFAIDADYGINDVGRDLTTFQQELCVEVKGLKEMGDSLLREMDDSETEVQIAWEVLDALIGTSAEDRSSEATSESAVLVASPRKSDRAKMPEISPKRRMFAQFSEGRLSLGKKRSSKSEAFPKRGILTQASEGHISLGRATPSSQAFPKRGLFAQFSDGRLSLGSHSSNRDESRRKSLALTTSPRSVAFQHISPTSTASMCSLKSPQSPVAAILKTLATINDGWLCEMLYRAAVRHEAKVWDTSLSLVAKVLDAVADMELERVVKLHSMLLDFLPRERRLFLGLPSIHTSVLEDLVELRSDDETVEEMVADSIQKRSKGLLKSDNYQRSSIMNRSRCVAPDLDGFSLALPGEAFNTVLLRNARVVERRAGMLASWKTTLAVVTADCFLHLFDCSAYPEIEVGSSPDAAYEKLLPNYEFPTVESTIRIPRSERMLQMLTPTDSLSLLNCTAIISISEEKQIEITETLSSRFIPKKLILGTKSREETEEWLELLQLRPSQELQALDKVGTIP